MSLLQKLFRKRTLAELSTEADALYDEQRFGDAKLAYDRLAERAAKEQPALQEQAEARAAHCCDLLALGRARAALRLHADGAHELAKEELKHALETARSAAAQAEVRAHLATLEQRESEEPREATRPLAPEEQLMLITASWEPLQAAELERYGEPLLEALLALEQGQTERARGQLEALIAAAKQPSYLWLELARAHLLSRANDAAERALRTFLQRIGPDEGGAARLLAHRELARIAHERGDRDAAVAELEAGAEALADDPRPLLDLGNYLRLIGRAREAVEVLELSMTLFDEGEVEWPITMELGLACAAAGEESRAITLLEGVLSALLAKGELDLPPMAALPLAQLHEKQGNRARAADLYRALTRGSDLENHAVYYREAARLLELLQLPDEASRMRERAGSAGERAGAEPTSGQPAPLALPVDSAGREV